LIDSRWKLWKLKMLGSVDKGIDFAIGALCNVSGLMEAGSMKN